VDRFKPGDAVLAIMCLANGEPFRLPGKITAPCEWQYVRNRTTGKCRRVNGYRVDTSAGVLVLEESALIPARIALVCAASTWDMPGAAWRPKCIHG
jgi:hypothetical protein